LAKQLVVVGETNLNTARVNVENYYSYGNQKTSYTSDPVVNNQGSLIEGYFYEKNMVKEMAIRKVNKTLCGLLCVAIIGAFFSYYFSMTNALELNALSRKITTLNDENADLQNNLDKLKSFNNVDNKMAQFNVLQKPEKVIEVQAIPTATAPIIKNKDNTRFNWAIGY
jgi:hypothetical protein